MLKAITKTLNSETNDQ